MTRSRFETPRASSRKDHMGDAGHPPAGVPGAEPPCHFHRARRGAILVGRPCMVKEQGPAFWALRDGRRHGVEEPQGHCRQGNQGDPGCGPTRFRCGSHAVHVKDVRTGRIRLSSIWDAVCAPAKTGKNSTDISYQASRMYLPEEMLDAIDPGPTLDKYKVRKPERPREGGSSAAAVAWKSPRDPMPGSRQNATSGKPSGPFRPGWQCGNPPSC